MIEHGMPSKTVVSSTAETEVVFSITYSDLAGNEGAAAAKAILQDADGTNVTVEYFAQRQMCQPCLSI